MAGRAVCFNIGSLTRDSTSSTNFSLLETAVGRGAASLYFSSVVSLVLSTAFFVVAANVLSTAEVGIIAALNILTVFLGTVASLALPQGVSKFIPEFISRGETAKAKGTLRVAIILVGGVASVLVASVVFGSNFLVQSLFKGQAQALWLVLLGADVFLYTIGQLFLYALIGLNDIPRASLFQVIAFGLRFGLSASLVVLGYGITGILLGFISGNAALLLLSMIASSKSLRGQHDDVSPKLLIGYSAPLLVSLLINFAILQIDKIFTWLLRATFADLGIYNIAVGAANIANLAPVAVTTALLPTLSSLDAKNDQATLVGLSRKYTRYVSLISIPVAFMLASLSTALIQIFGTAYLVGALPLSIMSVAIGITSVAAVYGGELMATKRTKAVMVAYVAGLVVFAGLLAGLVPNFGFVGAAWSRAFMTVVVLAAMMYFAKRNGLLALDRKAFVLSILASSIMGLILYFSTATIGGYRRQIAALPALIPLGIAVYLFVLRLLKVFTREDIEFLSSLLPTKLKGLAKVAGKLAGVL